MFVDVNQYYTIMILAGKEVISNERLETALFYCIKRWAYAPREYKKYWLSLRISIKSKYISILRSETAHD